MPGSDPEPSPQEQMGNPGVLPDELRAVAARLFGAELERAERYAAMLSTEGLTRGLLGPREADRIWDRHLLNSAVLALIIPVGAAVVDVGSGAGLPGIPLALARPDLRVVLLEPLLRRVRFLNEIVTDLSLDESVRVVRGRAPEDAAALPFPADYAVARAVAPLERLVGWTMPMVRMDGELLALRGTTAHEEVRLLGAGAARVGGSPPEVLAIGADILAEPVNVVRVRRTGRPPRRRSKSR